MHGVTLAVSGPPNLRPESDHRYLILLLFHQPITCTSLKLYSPSARSVVLVPTQLQHIQSPWETLFFSASARTSNPPFLLVGCDSWWRQAALSPAESGGRVGRQPRDCAMTWSFHVLQTKRLFHSATIFCGYICICCLKLHQADYQVEEVFFFFFFLPRFGGGALSSNAFTICAVCWSLGHRGYFGVSNVALVYHATLLSHVFVPDSFFHPLTSNENLLTLAQVASNSLIFSLISLFHSWMVATSLPFFSIPILFF